ncbi:hypothetical protein SAMN03097699_0349 [Flavobacteriaceae bacterium MAR_2010_188]|nr:hypothetical protein SAMN03097699_0349 [Flavobacteriaceae bacterium MAR_2010_188]
MLLAPINLENKLRKAQSRNQNQESILELVAEILKRDAVINQRIENSLNSGRPSTTNNFIIDHLESDRIFHIDAIKKICVDYRLRFLDSVYFKPKFPQEAITKIKELEKLHQTELKGFKIIAPSKLMKLENADDPLLFAPIGNGYFYLIHKWGNDLQPLRKWLYLPFKDINNILLFAVAASFVITLLIPNSIYHPENATSEFWFLFLFIFKAVGFILIFYGVSLGKNFNEQIWNSKYYNS